MTSPADDLHHLPPPVSAALLALVQAIVEALPCCGACATLSQAEAVLAEVQRPPASPHSTLSRDAQRALDQETVAEIHEVWEVLQLFHPIAATPWQIAVEVELPEALARMILSGLVARGDAERPRKGYYRARLTPARQHPEEV